MKLIVISDIFGRTLQLVDLIREFSDVYCETVIIDPYEGLSRHFKSEEQAYHQFQRESGLKNLLEKAAQEIRRSDTQVDILGFSIGGTCAWNLASQGDYKQIRLCLCFYGSRIRDYIESVPQVRTTIIFPRLEAAFDIEPVIRQLSKKNNTEVIQTPYLHGFMNKASNNYSEAAYQYFIPWLRHKAVSTSS